MNLLLASLVFTSMAMAATTRNDDSCDIAVAPAATLLLPYFEVDLDNRVGQTTIFTVTNVTSVAQIARVTLWTDFAYPVFTFNLYLTGYDVHTIDLYDVLNGTIRTTGRHGMGAWVSPRGDLSKDNSALDESECGHLPETIPQFQVERMHVAFTEGRVPGCDKVGSTHWYAVGYATIDVVGNCGTAIPIDAEYFTNDLRFDNALIGDYQSVDPGVDFAQASPMVHIRAIGERRRGRFTTNLPRTFYGRFQGPARPNADARQPLPSTFAARWANGTATEFQTRFKIWREARTNAAATCRAYADNARLELAESVVFDEDENGEGEQREPCPVTTCIGKPSIVLPATSLVSIADDEIFPQDVIDTEASGWAYLNLNDYGFVPRQAWVVVSMGAESRFTIEMDATPLGNGCSALTDVTSFTDGGAPGVLPGPTP
ncbi:MAG TPA: hypothetical protein VEK79_03085 [Thermoanaerobaculia bacterium]|nr:hypothetical protein [Thermoanaerobaculia bacterium]